MLVFGLVLSLAMRGLNRISLDPKTALARFVGCTFD